MFTKCRILFFLLFFLSSLFFTGSARNQESIFKISARNTESIQLDTLQYSGFETDVPPAGWDTIISGGTKNWVQEETYQHSGSYSAAVEALGEGVDVWLVSDTLDLSSFSTCSLSFWKRGDAVSTWYSDNAWSIYVSTNSQNDPADFTFLTEIDTAGTEDTWVKDGVDLSTYAGNSKIFVAFRYNDADYGPGWWIDDVTFFSVNSSPEAPTLIRKYDGAIYNAWYEGVVMYECTLSLKTEDPQGDDVNYKILYGKKPDFSDASPWTVSGGPYGSGNVVTTAIPLGTGAAAETLFYWKARARDPDGTNEWGPWSEVRSFTMDMDIGDGCPYWYQVAGAQFEKCEMESLKVDSDNVVISGYEDLIKQGFEVAYLPSGWDTLGRGVSRNNWERTSDEVHTGSYSTQIDFDSKYEVDAWLVLDTLDLSSFSSCTLSFWGRDSFSLDYQYHGVWVSTTSQTDTVDFSEVTQISATTEGDWEKSTVDLSSYAGESKVFIAFRYEETNGTRWWVDDVNVKGVYSHTPGKGFLTSPPIVFSDLLEEDNTRSNWIGAKWSKSSAGDSIGLQFEYKNGGSWSLIPDGDLSGNSDGIYDMDSTFCNIDLSSLNHTVYDSIRLKATFVSYSTIKGPSNPKLRMWAMGEKSGITYVPEKEDEREDFYLKVTGPNPFVNRTTIRYYLPEKKDVAVKIFNVAGREIVSLVEECQKSGSHRVVWNGRDRKGKKLPGGLYYISVKAGQERYTEKVVLIR